MQVDVQRGKRKNSMNDNSKTVEQQNELGEKLARAGIEVGSRFRIESKSEIICTQIRRSA